MRELGLDMNRVNVNGGAVALEHPIGASGARVLVTLIYEMIRRDVHRGIAALCLGGGNAVAMAVERDGVASQLRGRALPFTIPPPPPLSPPNPHPLTPPH